MAPPLPDPAATPTFSQSYLSRAKMPATPQMTAYLLRLMAHKKSNLCVSADLSSTAQLLDLAEEIGDSIVMFKTHADIVSDWSDRSMRGLVEIARRKKFLLFEDRKFGDIGNTVQSQYGAGVHRIATWAHLVNANLFPGPAIIEALKSTAYSALAAANSTISTSITSGGPLIEDQINKATEQLRNSFLASRRGRAGPSGALTNGDSPGRAEGAAANAAEDDEDEQEEEDDYFDDPERSASFSGGHDFDDDMEEEVRMRREFQILRKPSVVSVSTTITSTTEYISPPPTGTGRSFGAVFPESHSDGDDTPDEAPPSSVPIPNPPLARGLLLLAQMSSKDNMFSAEYTAKCVQEARRHRDFVLGFVAQQALNQTPDDNFLVFTPGIQLPPSRSASVSPHTTRGARIAARSHLTATGLPAEVFDGPPSRGDALGQQYNTPRKAVFESGSDVIIVGRGILNASDRADEAERYRREGWSAYTERVGSAATSR